MPISTTTPKSAPRLDGDLLAQLLLRLEASEEVLGRSDERLPDLLLAALAGSLEAHFEGSAVDRPRVDSELRPEPGEAWLESITVCGFRGIADRHCLELEPAAGLTVVLGRNGSGKSSFAEAAELLFTGGNLRWDGRPLLWKKGWRNLHHRGERRIEACVRVDGEGGTTKLEWSWSAEESVLEEGCRRALRAQGASPVEDLGWDAAAQTFRPFLSYNELGSLIEEGPSKLHDALGGILGLEALSELADEIKRRRLVAEAPGKSAKARAKELVSVLTHAQAAEESHGSTAVDERLAVAAKLLRGNKWDIAKLRLLLDEEPESTVESGCAKEQSTQDASRSLVRLAAFPPLDSRSYSKALDTIASRLAEIRDFQSGDAGVAELLLAVLRPAIVHYEGRHAEEPQGVNCPVCQKSSLDAEWHADALQQVHKLEQARRELDEARQELTEAIRLLPEPPDVGLLHACAPWFETNDDPGNRSSPVVSWAAQLHDVRILIGLVATGSMICADLGQKLSSLRETASADGEAFDDLLLAAIEKHSELENTWRPLREQIYAWIPEAQSGRDLAPLAARLKAAETWLRQQATELRNERFTPIADAVLSNWKQLRTASNVDLRSIAFEGHATRRALQLDVSVDGYDGTALGVMSQGELHALALSLFLPRAMLDESPFRFVVIDDPVQAMDPARVDGLARVLNESALSRQVIVFTHDDRLAEAITRLEIPARLLEVQRGQESRVQVVTRRDPVSQALDEAFALGQSNDLPATARDRVVPGLCRVALEAACVSAFLRRRLGKGERHLDVQEQVGRCDKLLQKVALVLFDDPQRAGDVLARFNADNRRQDADLLQACNKGSHFGVQGAGIEFVRRAESLANELRRRD